MKCTAKIWVEDIGDGYAGNMACGGEMREVFKGLVSIEGSGMPKTLYQCEKCKTIQLQ